MAEVRATSLRLFTKIGEQEFPLVLKFGWNRANRQIAALSSRRSVADMDTKGVFDLAWPAISDFIRARPREYSPMVTDTTIDRFRAELVRLFDEGKGIKDMARSIEGFFGAEGRVRATRVARTEIISASAKGSLSSYESAGADVVEGKTWLSTKDPPRVRDTHLAADGQERRLDEPFAVGDSLMMHPGDPSLNASLGEIVN